MIDPVSSLRSYVDAAGSAAKVGASRMPIAGAAPGLDGLSFGDVLAQVSGAAIDTIKQGEAASLAGIQGKATVQQVVEAVMSAEQALQSAIAIRDKVVAAYQEVSRMAI